MTSPTSGFRRTVFAATAAVAALGLSACGAGQLTQTSSQPPAVDGGNAWSQNFSVHDLRVVLPEDGDGGDSGDAEVGFGATYRGPLLSGSEGVQITSLTIDGKTAEFSDNKTVTRNCGLIAAVEDSAADMSTSMPESPADPCLQYVSVTIPASGFQLGQSYPATMEFSNGESLKVFAATIRPPVETGEFTRAVETYAPAE